MKGLSNRRLRLIGGLSVLAFAVVIGRAIQIQGVDASALGARAVSQQQSAVTVPGTRGTIYSADGQPLAQEEPSVTIVANQPLIRNVPDTAAYIALQLGYRDVLVPHVKPGAGKKRLAFVQHRRQVRARYLAEVKLLRESLTGTSHYAYVLRQLPPQVAAKILANHHILGLTGVPDARRFYPYGSLAAQVLGYTDIDSSGQNGGGLELDLDGYLKGVSGRQVTVSDPTGLTLETVTVKPARNGRDVHLTLRTPVQEEAQSVLAEAVRRSGARDGTAIVMNPRTGAILAMASAPTYDDNHVHQLPNLARTTNLATDMTYEPGSIFKVVTFSAALSLGIIYPGMVFHNVPNALHVADKVIHDAEARGPETFTASQILARSSNIGTDIIGGMVGENELLNWISRYGFGHYPALRFPGDSPGIVPHKGQWSGSTIGTVPIGQGISVTPLQIADAYAAIANSGVMPEPHLVQSIQGVKMPRLRSRRVLSTTVDRELVTMLEGVVAEPFGTGQLAQIPGYRVAGKTGTAQKAGPHGYLPGKYMASFVGFLPASNPQVEIMVVLDSPRSEIYGGQVAAPAFATIGAWYAKYAGLKPDKPVSTSN